MATAFILGIVLGSDPKSAPALLSSVKQESAYSLHVFFLLLLFSSYNSNSSWFWHQHFPLLANKVSMLCGPFVFLSDPVYLWFCLPLSVMLAITVLLVPKNGNFASGEIGEYIVFMVTFQIHFKARSPKASTIRDLVHPWRLIEAEHCYRNCCINYCPMACYLCWSPILLKLKPVAELQYYLFVGKGRSHRKHWTSL